jgi:hypothetical protein
LIRGQPFPKAGGLGRWGGGGGGEELWSRTRSGVHAVGDVDGDPALEVLMANGTELCALDRGSVAPGASFSGD